VLAYADIFMYAAVMAFIMIPFSFLVSPRIYGRAQAPNRAGVRH
jgi:hypothetical protein